MASALGEAGAVEEEETYEDRINRLMESRKFLPNASYFAFTATPEEQDAWRSSATRIRRATARSNIFPSITTA